MPTAANLELPPDCVAFTGTRAQVLALRAANALPVGCGIVITDWVQGTTLTGPNRILLHAIDASTLGTQVDVFTPFDNVGWKGVYDIDNTVVNATGTMLQLTDTLGNTAQNILDGVTVGQFPWGSTKFRNNYVQDSTLTGWSTYPGAANSFNGNRVLNSTVNLTGIGAASTFVDNVMDGVNFAATANTLLATRNTFQGGSFTKSASQGLTVTDSQFIGSTVTHATVPAAGTAQILRSRIVGSTINRTGNGAGTNTWTINDSDVLASTFNLLGGSFTFNSSYANAAAINIGSGRGLAIASSNISNSTVNQQRTNAANTDSASGLTMSGGSTFTLTGASDAGGVGGAAHSNSEIVNGSTFTSNAPIGNNSAQLLNARIAGGSTLNLQGAASRFLTGRVDNGAVVTMGNFVVQRTILELAGALTLTAAQNDRLLNKAFSDVI